MDGEIFINTLVENTVNIPGLKGEHGVSFLIRLHGRKALFDTGQTDLLLENAERMGLGLSDVSAIVISHGHFDHTGGLTAAMAAAPNARVWLHRRALEPKFSRQADGRTRYNGMPPAVVSSLRQAAERVEWVSERREVLPGLFSTGPIPRQTDFEETSGHFFREEECVTPDSLEDEQSLYFDTSKGLVVVLGCGHPGVINTLRYVQDLARGRPIHTVMGGFHLLSASEQRLDRTIEALRELEVRRVIPAHCTGALPAARMWQAFPNRCTVCPVGTNLAF